MTADKAGHGVIDNKLVMDIYMLRCNSATVIARSAGNVNGPKSVAICRQCYVTSGERTDLPQEKNIYSLGRRDHATLEM